MRGDVDGHRLSVCRIILVGIRRAVPDRLDRMVDVWFFRQNARMKHKKLTRGCFFRQNELCSKTNIFRKIFIIKAIIFYNCENLF